MASNEPPPPERNQIQSPSSVEVVDDEVARRTCPVCLRVFDSTKAMWGHSWVHREKREQIHSMAPPAPPVAMGPTADVAPVVGGSSWHPWKIDSKDERDRTCPRCAKVFSSPKAMFGHLHVHYERSTSARRAKGEGGSNHPEPNLVQIERSTNNEEEMKGENVEESDSPVSIDLNRPVCMEERGDDMDLSPSSIDLNKTPPSS